MLLFLEEIVILGVIYGILVWRVCNPAAPAGPTCIPGLSPGTPPVGSQHSCQPTVHLHILPLVWMCPLVKGQHGGAGGSSWNLPWYARGTPLLRPYHAPITGAQGAAGGSSWNLPWSAPWRREINHCKHRGAPLPWYRSHLPRILFRMISNNFISLSIIAIVLRYLYGKTHM